MTKVLEGYTNYLIFEDSSILDIKRNVLMAQFPNEDGYLKVTLRDDSGKRKTFSVHRLIAALWLDNPECKKEVNHKDGVKTNNLPSNLEWATHSENLKHAWDTGLLKNTEERSRKISEAVRGKNTGKANPRSRSVYCITTDEIFDTIKDACEKYSVQQAQLSKCCSPKYPNKTAGKHPESKLPLEWRYYEQD